MIREGNSSRCQDYEWYDASEDSDLKNEALINKGTISGDGAQKNKEWFDDHELMEDDNDDIDDLEDYLIQKDHPYYVIDMAYPIPLIWRIDLSWISIHQGIREFKKETRDLDMEIKQMKELKANYGITSPFIINMEDEVDINTLTIEQYMAWVQDDIRPDVVKPNIGNDVEFEINSNFMKELRRKLFKGTDDEDAHQHVRRVLEIVYLFHFPGVTHDAIMLRVFPVTLKGPHDLNCQQKVHIFYTGLDILTRRVLDSKGFIPLMTPTQALISIQVMAEHSHNWYDEATTRERINDSPNNVDTKKPKENIHAIQASFKNCEGANLTMECPLEKEDKALEKFIENTDSNIRALKTTTKNLQEKTYQLTQTVLTNTGEKVKERTTIGKENVKEPVPRDLPVVQTYVPPTQFLGNPYRTREIICAIGIPEEIHEDEGDMNDGCDITVDDVERLRKILTPSIHTLPNLKPIVQPYMPLGLVCNKAKVVREEEQDYDIPLQDHVMQPLTPQTVHITPPDDDYVASATNPILNKHLNEFGEEFADNTRVFEKIDSNPVNDLKELLKTYDFENFIRKLKHQLSQSSHKTGSLYKEMEFEVPLTRVRVVVRFCLGVTT
ncbi:hypothetical protein Tco_0975155 [Tanacetum coccineum]|uniref:Reverse transcriptase domain-containing protein n=1 Tax=Tanacetum coccineum TaxID=301880 RepID=A0ABQ5EDX0_9ASTR